MPAEFPSGTQTIVKQASAPISWTKQTTDTDTALRLVNGSVSSGGALNFSDVFAATKAITIGNTTLSTSTMPTHDHDVSCTQGNLLGNGDLFPTPYSYDNLGTRYTNKSYTSYSGSSSAHNHASIVNINVAYADFILIVKD